MRKSASACWRHLPKSKTQLLDAHLVDVYVNVTQAYHLRFNTQHQ